MADNYRTEKDWVKKKLDSGAKIDRRSSFYQTLKRAEKNMSDVQAFMKANDVDSHTY